MLREKLADKLSISIRTLQRWEKEGKMPRAHGRGRGNKARYDQFYTSDTSLALMPEHIVFMIWRTTGLLIVMDDGVILWRSPVKGRIIKDLDETQK